MVRAIGRKFARLLRRLAAARRRLRYPVLARPLQQAGDGAIDAALGKAGLSRADLFTPGRAVARHRVLLAHMLAARSIDATHAAKAHWQSLKDADQACAECPNVGRCLTWLELGWPEEAAAVFCPNSDLFSAIAAEQNGTVGPGAGKLEHLPQDSEHRQSRRHQADQGGHKGDHKVEQIDTK